MVLKYINWLRIRSLGLHLVFIIILLMQFNLFKNGISGMLELFVISFLTLIIFDLHSYIIYVSEKQKTQKDILFEIENIKDKINHLEINSQETLEVLLEIKEIINSKSNGSKYNNNQ